MFILEYIVISLMILFLSLGFKIFNLLEGRVNSLILTFSFVISYSFIMNRLFEIFEWKAIVFFFIPSIVFWLVDFEKYQSN